MAGKRTFNGKRCRIEVNKPKKQLKVFFGGRKREGIVVNIKDTPLGVVQSVLDVLCRAGVADDVLSYVYVDVAKPKPKRLTFFEGKEK